MRAEFDGAVYGDPQYTYPLIMTIHLYDGVAIAVLITSISVCEYTMRGLHSNNIDKPALRLLDDRVIRGTLSNSANSARDPITRVLHNGDSP